LGGGGESTLNPSLNDFIQALYENNIAKGIVTNGIAIKEHRHLKHMDWVGVSVDAGDKEVWSKVHGVKPELFQQVLDNMKYLVDQQVDVTYKYLVRPENVGSVYCAIRHAADIGCAAFHIRPMATPWFDDIQPIFTERDIELVNEQLHRARKAFGKHIDIVGVFNKLDSQWRVAHPFEKCWAIFATCVFQANKKVGLCCDLRGCQTVEVGPFDNPEDFINNFWGSDKHKKIQEQVDVNKCSRCTFSMLNQYFEQAIIQDRLMPYFI
jgi:MoaA/NifB/PqqE/SkfB family radical SAM enzyme